MLLLAVPDETYCPKTQAHVPGCNGINHTCYRCGMLLGPCDDPKLGSMLDF